MLWKANFSAYVVIHWLIGCIFRYLRPAPKPLHIIFCMVDHFEPGTGGAGTDLEKERMQLLLSKYPVLSDNHRDSGGNHPKRTWFFPPHYHRHNNLRELVSLCERGYGEIELHLHHGKIEPDSSENLEKTIRQCIEEYSQFGIFGIENMQKRYAFIHGDWALDNSRKGEYCGVNNEIEILRKTGCFADFTFPSLNRSNPLKINSIYYATDNPHKPKSYNKGKSVRYSGEQYGDLMMIQGPLHPFFIKRNLFSLRAVGDSIDKTLPVTDVRIDYWVKTGIHVKRKPEWVILKTHTHGATASEIVLGKEMDYLHSYLESNYNDGENYILHYVTARELYNIIKAAEAGELENKPEAYRDYIIKPPVYNSAPDIAEASAKLKQLIAKTYRG